MSELRLEVLERHHMETIIIERNKVLEVLRTPYRINGDMQETYFIDTICNRNSTTRYWAVYDDDKFVAMGGVENIIWENGLAELSVLVFEKYRKQGYGKQAVAMFLDNAFNYLGLENVYGECYLCNSIGVVFWKTIIKKYKAYKTILPNRKYYKGKYWDSIYFNIKKSNING